MHFDDRLETVLRLSATGKAFARIQYRQLLDILGSDEVEAGSPAIEAAYRRLDELSGTLPASERAAMLRPSLFRLRSPRLLACLADNEPAVASAAMAMAELSERQWLDLIPALPVRARGILRHRRGQLGPRIEMLLAQLGIGDRGLPPADAPLELTDIVEPEGRAGDAALEPAIAGRADDIAMLLKRIENFSRARRERAPQAAYTDAPRLPLDDHDDLVQTARAAPFDFATDTRGRIVRAESAVAPMIVGMRIAASDGDGALNAPADIVSALRRRQPLRDVPVAIDGAPAISGDWRIDATPCFEPGTGSFSGYAGRFRRPCARLAADSPAPEAPGEADRIRQILHELKTPANAIQIAAEIIQQNLFGPTPHEYRAIAAIVASDIAYVLAGFDELERLARLEGNAIELDEGQSDVAHVAEATVDHLQAFTAKRQSGFSFSREEEPLRVTLSEAEAERLVWRLLAVLAGEAAPSEILELSCTRAEDEAVLAAQLPASLAARDEEALFRTGREFGSNPKAISAGMFGTGLSLRLARAEARAAGGSLKRDGNHLFLRLPATPLPDGDRERA